LARAIKQSIEDAVQDTFSIKDQRTAEKWLLLIKSKIQITQQLSGREGAFADDQLCDVYQMYLGLVAVRERPVRRVPKINFGFVHVPENCGTDYRFRTRGDLRELYTRLQVPAVLKLPNKQKVRGEQAFLYFIRGLSVGSRLHDHIPELGGEKSSWSRCFNTVARYSHRDDSILRDT
jgi:hypothetical protein